MIIISKSYSTENDDIYDSNIDSVYSEQFKDILHEINSIILPKFSAWDNKALSYQKYRQTLMLLMILTGLIALTRIIPGIYTILPENWGIIIQNVAALLVLVSLLIGISCNFQKKWLLYRHKSELLRLLKFHALLDPTIFSVNREIPLKRLKQNVNEIDKIDQKIIDKFTKDEFIFWEYDRITSNQLDKRNFLNLIKYYQDKRIKLQIDYFEKRAKYREKVDYYTKYLPKVTNFISVFLLCVYFVFGIFFKEDTLKNTSLLVIIAAILPVLGSSIKSYRTTNEIARIASIYRTRQNKLANINNTLIFALKQENIDINKELELIYECERILKDEHQEWLRLMIQSEWIT